eukprot:scaffold117865_cov26-Tisochrysis_lutea.AAC.2
MARVHNVQWRRISGCVMPRIGCAGGSYSSGGRRHAHAPDGTLPLRRGVKAGWSVQASCSIRRDE